MLVTLSRPPVVKAAIAKRSFFHSAPVLRNSLPATLRQPAPLSEAGGTLAILAFASILCSKLVCF